MQGPDFIYFFQNKNRQFWGINSSGDVTLSGNPYMLVFSPDGWLDTTVENIRNKKYWGVDRTVAAPFKYVEDGARILKNIFYKRGPEEPVYLVICHQQLAYDPPPKTTLAVLTGSNPFSAGNNTGTISGTPGTKAYIRLSFTSGDPELDGLSGTINGSGIAFPGTAKHDYEFTIPSSGTLSYSFDFVNGSGTGTASINVVGSTGSLTGSYGYWYKQIFRSEVDLSKFNHAGAYVTAPTVEEGIAKHLKANENTVYELPLNVADAIKVKMDGILLSMKQPYAFLSDFTYEGTDIKTSAMGLTQLNNEGRAPYISVSPSNYELAAIDNSFFEYLVNSPNYFLKNTGPSPVDINLSGKLRLNVLQLNDTNTIRFQIWQVQADATTGNNHWTTHNLVGNSGNFFVQVFSSLGITEININLDVTAQPGDRFFIVFDRDPFATNLSLMSFSFETDSILNVNFQTRFTETYIKALRAQYIFSELIRLMTGGEFSADECPYFGELQHIDKVFTSGDGIRGLEDAKVKISFSQFFAFWNTFDEVGIRELNGKLLLDRKKSLLDLLNVIDLGEVNKPVITLQNDYPFNELAIGFPDLKNENGFVNGKNEFNTTFIFSQGTTKNPRKYEKTTTIRTSCYDAENIRISQAQKDTTDNKNDNEVYAMHIEKELQPEAGDIPAHYLLDRTLNPFLTGIDQKDSIFNVIFSPKRCLKRSSDFLHSCFYKSDSRKFKYVSSDRNSGMAYINGPDVVVENADENIGGFDPAFFLPVSMAIETAPPDDLLPLLDANPLISFQFTIDGQVYKGISEKNRINPGSLGVQTFNMLSVADNNLEKLIDYYG